MRNERTMTRIAANWASGTGLHGTAAIAALAATWQFAARTTGAATWYRTGERATRPVTEADLEQLLAEGINHSDVDGKPMPDLGRSLSLWDGHDATFSAHIESHGYGSGNYAAVEHPNLPATDDAAWPLMHELITIWAPDTATWTTDDIALRGHRAGLTASGIQLGALTWIRDGIPSPFTGCEAAPIAGGTLYRLGHTPDDVTADVIEQALRPRQ